MADLLYLYWIEVLTRRSHNHPDSFEQLPAILRHSVTSQHVSHLLYELDTLIHYESQKAWEADPVDDDNDDDHDSVDS